MMNGLDINDKQFLKLPDIDTKLLVVLQNIREIKKQCTCRQEKCRKEFKKTWGDKAISAASGFMGGFIAVITWIIAKAEFWK